MATPNKILPAMTAKEIDLYSTVLKNSKKYMEFGAGRSTIYVLENFNLNKLISMETSLEYIGNLKNKKVISKEIASGTLEIIHIDIGQTKKLGYPVDMNNKQKLLNYTLSLWPKLPKDIDLCLVDGRFRVATSLLALIYLMECDFLFHDFNNRPFYHRIIRYIDIIDTADTMIYYVAKRQIDKQEILCDIIDYLYDAR